MIQATDFVCPTCSAQVNKPCKQADGTHKFGKPHPTRRNKAALKRLKEKDNK